MSRFDQDWCNALAEQAGDATTQGDDAHLLYVVTDTSEGKVAFHIGLVDGAVEHVTAGKLPRGEKADITITATEATLGGLWSGDRSRDSAFMAGDIKIEGAYAQWLDQLVPLFEAAPWRDAWASA